MYFFNTRKDFTVRYSGLSAAAPSALLIVVALAVYERPARLVFGRDTDAQSMQ